MKISNRIQALATSPIRRLTPYAAAAKAKGKKIYHLNIGQPDIPTPPEFLDSIKNYHPDVIAYGNSKGKPALIKAIAAYYQSWQMDYAEEDIYVTNGGSEALSFAIMTVCDPGDEILICEPFYANYNSFATILNVNMKPVPSFAAEGYHLPEEKVLEAAITSKTKAILITNPGNPTGVVYTKAEMEMISRVVRKFDLILIADEVYREFVYDGVFNSFGTMPELADRLIIVDSISKRYSACGARIGCLVAKNQELCQQFNKCCQSRLCVPDLEQVGAAALYTTPVAYLKAVNDEYRKRRDTIKEELAKIPGLISSDPKGAFYVMVKMPVDDAEKFAIWLLEEFSVAGETVMIAPGNGFYATPNCGIDEARLAYVLNCEDLRKAITILGQALAAYPGRK